MLPLRGIAPLQFDAIGPGRTLFRHHYAQHRFVGHIMRRSILNAWCWHDVLAVADSELSLSFPGIVRLPHTLLMPATTSATILVPRPVRLLSPIV